MNATPATAEIQFPEGELYDCRDSESLTHDDPIEAIVYHVDGFLSPSSDTAKIIREDIGAVTVTAFRRASIEPLSGIAVSLGERAAEFWSENYAGPDGEADLDQEDIEAFAKAIEPALAALFSKQTPWRCDPCGQVDLSAEQVVALMREACPHWFDDEAEPAPGTEVPRG